MRHPTRKSLALLLASALLACAGPGEEKVEVPGHEGALKTSAAERAERRAYDGAPPVVPHENFGIECIECHNLEGMSVEGVGYAPPSPHDGTSGLSAIAHCRQCHVFQTTDAVFAANEFRGLRQDLRSGERLNAWAPPTIPHKVFMRENCQACHSGPAAREEIRTPHPDRPRCRQCHVEVVTRASFEGGFGP